MSSTHREGRWRGRRPRARHGGAKRRSAEGEERRSPSPVWGSGGIAPRKFWNLTVQICLFFPRFQVILLLHITHSSKVNCTLDKVNCTLCVRKHTILGPGSHGSLKFNHLLVNTIRNRSLATPKMSAMCFAVTEVPFVWRWQASVCMSAVMSAMLIPSGWSGNSCLTVLLTSGVARNLI